MPVNTFARLLLLVTIMGILPVNIGSAQAQAGPTCSVFGQGATGLEGWGACPAAPNIAVTTSSTASSGGKDDYYLHLKDLSGASSACSTHPKYLGDWVEKMGGCGQFCFDFKVFKSGTPPSAITPSFTIWSGTTRATFRANFSVLSSDPWKQKICVPVKEIKPGENLPSGAMGGWEMLPTASAFNASWNTLIRSVTMIQFPIDWTADPSEEAGYDNLCMNPASCQKPPQPSEITGCLKSAKLEIKCNPDGTYTVVLSDIGFTGTDITMAPQSAGVTVTPSRQPWAAATTWTVAGAKPGDVIKLLANAALNGGGSAPGLDSCCSGAISFVAPECPQAVASYDLGIKKTGFSIANPVNTPATFTLDVANYGAPITVANAVTVTDTVPPGLTFTSATGTGWTCTSLPASAGSSISCAYSGAVPIGTGTPLPPITIKATGSGDGPFENCATVGFSVASRMSDTRPDNNKSCVTVHPFDKPIDLAVQKTGGTSPAATMNAYAFHIDVTSKTGVYAGANVIRITDIVPAGMTFTSAGGANWTCSTLPAMAGSTITCTYTGAGPATSNQSLGRIDISATALGSAPFPPFENCARAGLATGSGQQDTNPENDQSCVIVRKPDSETPAGHDVAIRKTGGGAGGTRGPNYVFTLDISNPGAAFTGSHELVVRDVAPAGVNFLSASGANWACNAPVSAGSTLICTYTGSGTIGSGTALGSIAITAMGPANAPFQNCASVAFKLGSSFNDANQANNRSCVSVNGTETAGPVSGGLEAGSLAVRKEIVNTTPAQLPELGFAVTVTCGPTATKLTLAGNGIPQTVSAIPLNTTCTLEEDTPSLPQSICGAGQRATWNTTYDPAKAVAITGPGMTAVVRNTLACIPQDQKGGLSIPPILPVVTPPKVQACVPPLKAQADGTCTCPQGTMRRGRQCVEPPKAPKCRPPMLQSATGACVCPDGLLQRGRQCVRPSVCKAPARPNGRGGCLCPRDMQLRGNSCVAKPVPQPRVAPGDAIRILPGLMNVFRPGFGPGRPSQGPRGMPGRP